MHRLLLLFIAMSGVGFCVMGRAAEHKHAHGGMSGDRSAQTELGAQAAFDAKGILWAAHKVSGHIAVSRSDDRGRSWLNPVLVTSAPEPTDTGGDARPKIALGPGGEVYVTWTKPLAKPFTGEIKYSRSLDGGRTFSLPAVVHQDRQEITHRFDSIAVNAQGQVVVAWIDKRDLAAAAAMKAPPYRGAAIYFAVSDDRGATFRGDYKLADNTCECCRIALACHADGSVTAMWRHVFEPNIRDHAVAKLFPVGNAGPVRRASFEDCRIDACPHAGPALVEDAQRRLHAVWFSAAPPPNQGVFYGRLREGGVDALRHIGGEAAARPDLAVLGNRVAVAWKEFDGERTRLRGMSSLDGGEHWRDSELAATSGPSDQPCVLIFGDRFHVFWNTREQPLSVVAFPQ